MDKAALGRKRPRLWARCPIKYKLGFTVGLMLAALALVLFSAQRQTAAIMQATYAQENDYYNINSFQTTLIAAGDALESYLHDPDEGTEYAESWRTSCVAMRRQLSLLNLDPASAGVDRYLLAQAITNGFEPYVAHCETLLSMRASGAGLPAMYDEYNTISSVSGYLLQTTRQLQSDALSDGQMTLADLRVHQQEQNNIQLFFGIAAAGFFLVMLNELIRSIVSPVLRLSEASKAISEGNFDTPDVIVENRDEIYTLAQAFNRMKDSMKHLFDTMRKNTEMEQRLYQKELEASESRRLLEQAKMQQLRNQINPHFLFNTLNIISRTARREKAVTSEKLILALARLFRYSLKTDDTEVPLSREVRIVNDYVSIQATRFENRVALRWRISPSVDAQDVQVPAFVLQPIVENAVIHGLEPKLEGGVIRIRAHILNDTLYLIISDNGVGMDRDTLRNLLSQQNVCGDVSGIGIGNVRSRLLMLNPDSHFQISSRPGCGTCVRIALPHPGRLSDAAASPIKEAEPHAQN